MIDSHFLSNTIDEAKVIQDFYVKTETVRCIGGVLGVDQEQSLSHRFGIRLGSEHEAAIEEAQESGSDVGE